MHGSARSRKHALRGYGHARFAPKREEMASSLHRIHPRDRLIRCGPFGMIDHEHIDGRPRRFEFEAELFLHRRE